MSRRVLIAGSTGLIGRELVALLAAESGNEVHALARRVPGDAPEDDSLHWLVVDFARLGKLPAADEAYCALGTTIRAAGSKSAFRAVDFGAVLAFAHAAKAAGATRLAVVSALGADAKSSVFYNRVKGEMEDALRVLGFERLVIARPSLLAGDRAALGQGTRPGERLALALTAPVAALIPKRWRPIDAKAVARALRHALRDSGARQRIIESRELQELGA
jgi:uncharacterized protein YbjT (DUF2867 family)